MAPCSRADQGRSSRADQGHGVVWHALRKILHRRNGRSGRHTRCVCGFATHPQTALHREHVRGFAMKPRGFATGSPCVFHLFLRKACRTLWPLLESSTPKLNFYVTMMALIMVIRCGKLVRFVPIEPRASCIFGSTGLVLRRH